MDTEPMIEWRAVRSGESPLVLSRAFACDIEPVAPGECLLSADRMAIDFDASIEVVRVEPGKTDQLIYRTRNDEANARRVDSASPRALRISDVGNACAAQGGHYEDNQGTCHCCGAPCSEGRRS